jgi:hypothetical protein
VGWIAYVIVVVVALVLIAATVMISWLAWQRQVRAIVHEIIGHAEAIKSALRTTETMVTRLAGGSVEELLAFAEPTSEDRSVLSEVASRMRLASIELTDQRLPQRLWPLSDHLIAAASALADEVGTVGEAASADVLDALVAFDLERGRTQLAAAEREIETLVVAYKLGDSAVYGGGLYI